MLRSNSGAHALALLSMRTALRMGDPAGAAKIAETVPANGSIRSEPDFQWMLASAHFLSRDYAAAEAPLLALFRSSRSTASQKAAAAYGLCGVYQKIGNPVEQLRFALWLHTGAEESQMGLSNGISDLSLYWAVSGWDLDLLLDSEAPIEALQSFVEQNPGVPDLRLVQYSLAVRLARADRYEEAADVYESIHAHRRAPRMRQLAELYRGSVRTDLTVEQRLQARYQLADFIGSHPNGIYFNDAVWQGYQRYAFQGSTDSRLTRSERESLMNGERKLKDSQEEYWRAYLILRDIVRESSEGELTRRAARRAVQCLQKISDRFGREDEIRSAELELAGRLHPR